MAGRNTWLKSQRKYSRTQFHPTQNFENLKEGMSSAKLSWADMMDLVDMEEQEEQTPKRENGEERIPRRESGEERTRDKVVFPAKCQLCYTNRNLCLQELEYGIFAIRCFPCAKKLQGNNATSNSKKPPFGQRKFVPEHCKDHNQKKIR
jgi:hypothetical protein